MTKRIGILLQKHLPQLDENPLELRAARMGFHLNRFNVRALAGSNPDEAAALLKNQIIKSQRRYSRRLCLLRQHYELSRIQLITYVNVIDQLGDYSGAPA